mgnify:CR=1 FL=1
MSKVSLKKVSKCPSCGAPVEPSALQCEYCGSYFIPEKDDEDFSKDKFSAVLNSTKETSVICIHGRGLEKGEYPIRSGPANLYRGWMNAAGGHLVLTNRRFLFIDHGLNLEFKATPEEESIYLKDVADVEAKTVMLVSKRIVVHKKDGTFQEYVIWNQKKWVDISKNVLANI